MSQLVLIVQLKIKPEEVDRFMKMALENAEVTRITESGCRQFDVVVDPEDTTRVLFYEVYDDAEAFEAHQQTAHFKNYLETAVPLLESRARAFYRRVAP